MAEAGFPGQHTTTTTVTSSTTVQTNIRFDSNYLSTLPGMLKVVQVASSLLGFICIMASGYSTSSIGSYFCWISMIAFWFTGILLGLYLFHLVEKFYKIPWLRIEFVFCLLWTVFFLFAACFSVSYSPASLKAAGVFGFFATAAYGADAFVKWRAARSGGLAQGARVVSTTTTSATVTRPEGY